MGSMSLWHWIVVGLVIILLFGRGRISEMMGDLAKGIKSFKKGLAEDDLPVAPTAPPSQVTHNPPSGQTVTGATSDSTPR